MNILVQLGLGLGAIAFILFMVRWQAKESQRQQDAARQERDDAEAQRKEWDIERRARNAVDTLDQSHDAVVSDAHNRDRKPTVSH